MTNSVVLLGISAVAFAIMINFSLHKVDEGDYRFVKWYYNLLKKT